MSEIKESALELIGVCKEKRNYRGDSTCKA